MTAAILLSFIGIVFLIQKNNIETAARDDQRKTAVNTMYYTLEKVYYPTHKSYPKAINTETLSSVEPSLLKDPNGKKIGLRDSDYRYEPTGCDNENDTCTGYALRALLENEADYVKTASR